jgi:CheY-like chemotaxis protein/HPt (histidine-containing phosphotransfer) domain-containing protein
LTSSTSLLTDDKRVQFRCEITDTGIGIPNEMHARIFEKFVQGDSTTTRKYGGTGLGLAITKQLVELMGGHIGVESEIEVGSTFWFTIPFEVTDRLSDEKNVRRKRMASGTIAPSAARILVAEDHPMNQMFMTTLLKRFGIGTFEIAENGTAVLKRHAENPWDVILMDCHMPEKNGYDTTNEIRDSEKRTGAHVPIIAMTANAMIGDKEKCLRYGMDEYLSKPVSIDELKEVLGQWIYFEEFSAAEGPLQTPPADGVALVDLSILESFSNGDVEWEKELIGIFVAQSDKNLRTLHEQRMGDEPEAWQEAAHMFKGAAGGVGAQALSKLCEEAQLFVGTARDRVALFEKISAEYARVKAYFEQTGHLS